MIKKIKGIIEVANKECGNLESHHLDLRFQEESAITAEEFDRLEE